MAVGIKAEAPVLGAIQLLGVNWMARQRMRKKALVLCYHGVVADVHEDRFRYANTVGVREFSEHLDFLNRHFKPICAADLLSWSHGDRELPEHAVLVTFDDGYRNNFTLAADVLRRHGIPCVFHVATGYIGERRMLWTDEVISRLLAWPHAMVPTPDGRQAALPRAEAERRKFAYACKERCKHLPWVEVQTYLERLRQQPAELADNQELFGFMNWDDVRSLAAQGFDIGSHTVNHPVLTQISADCLAAELIESKQRIEREIGEPCQVVAYPNGGREDFSADVIRRARDTGYSLGFTTIEDFNAPSVDPLALHRLCIMGHLPTSRFQYRVSGLTQLLAAS